MHLRGSICALVTPFHGHGEIDPQQLKALIEWQVGAGTAALVIAGSTGEAALLDDEEYSDLLAIAVDAAAGRVPIIAGIGSPSTRKSLALARRASAAGCAALLAVTPYYVRPTQAGLDAHYRLLADDGGLPLILYNVPARTGSDLLPATVAGLALHDNIVGIKEAVADPQRLLALLRFRSDRFSVFSGDDGTAVEAMLAGAAGTISVAANVLPCTFAVLCQLALTGDAAAARALDQELRGLYRVLGIESNPIPVKWLLHRSGRIGPQLRLPLQPLAPRLQAEVESHLPAVQQMESRFAGAV